MFKISFYSQLLCWHRYAWCISVWSIWSPFQWSSRGQVSTELGLIWWPRHESWQKWCLEMCWTWAEGWSLSVEADWSPDSPSVPGGKEAGDELPATKIRKEERWWLIPSSAANIHLFSSLSCPSSVACGVLLHTDSKFRPAWFALGIFSLDFSSL